MQLIVTSGHAARAFLDEHGDGFADLAFACEDVARTRATAEAAGAAVAIDAHGAPVVTGFGAVRHTLLACEAASGHRLPPGRAWRLTPVADQRGSAFRVLELDHVAACVEGGSLEKYADFYGAAFGLERYSSEYVAVGDQAMDSLVVRSGSGQVTFTLVAPDTAKNPGQLDSFLARNAGPGVQHLAFLVEDIVSAVTEARARGLECLEVPGAYYDRLAERLDVMRDEVERLRGAQVLADRDEWGDLLQLFTRSPYERNTLFYEVVERRGSRGFGAANIRALYESLARDMSAAE
jgi:4-hydroxymandelate synthase